MNGFIYSLYTSQVIICNYSAIAILHFIIHCCTHTSPLLARQLKHRKSKILSESHSKSCNHTLSLHRSTDRPWLPSTENSESRTQSVTNQLLHFTLLHSTVLYLAPFDFKITPFHGKHRLPLLWMHDYHCVAWQQTSCISMLLLDADSIENCLSLLLRLVCFYIAVP
jgi:hypothetical protein